MPWRALSYSAPYAVASIELQGTLCRGEHCAVCLAGPTSKHARPLFTASAALLFGPLGPDPEGPPHAAVHYEQTVSSRPNHGYTGTL